MLWLLWIPVRSQSPLIRWIVIVGFLGRALMAQLLFWISYRSWPIGRSLQLGNGFWFWGFDGTIFFSAAADAARHGIRQVLELDRTFPSVVYIKTIALLSWLFGIVPSVALVVNLAAYLGTVLIILAWARRSGLSEFWTAVPLAIVSFTPTWILWSLQPLKDPLFCFLLIAFGYALSLWIGAWQNDDERGATRARQLVVSAAMMLPLMYAISGIRWYVAGVLLASALIPLFSVVPTKLGAREVLLRTATTIVLLMLLARMIDVGAGPYVPEGLLPLLRPSLTTLWRASDERKNIAMTIESSRQNLDQYSKAGTRIGAGPILEKTPPPQQRIAAAPPKIVTRPSPPIVSSQPAASPGAVTASHVPLRTEESEGETIAFPRSVRGRLIAGVAALVLPRALAVKLGLVSMSGGRGLWWFAEIDTLFFDAIAVGTLFVLVSAVRKRKWLDPMLLYAICVTVMIAGLIAYTISNFGTLMRHREMVLAGIVLIPFIVGAGLQRERESVYGKVLASRSDSLAAAPTE
jgi:hypothetical protein